MTYNLVRITSFIYLCKNVFVGKYEDAIKSYNSVIKINTNFTEAYIIADSAMQEKITKNYKLSNTASRESNELII